jgi:hypothetical protein
MQDLLTSALAAISLKKKNKSQKNFEKSEFIIKRMT